MLEIERDRLLAPVAGVEICRGAVGGEGRAPVAGVVAGLGALDLHYIGAEVRKQLPRPGTREDPGKLQNLEARERLVHRSRKPGSR